jgi:hypothetical protein
MKLHTITETTTPQKHTQQQIAQKISDYSGKEYLIRLTNHPGIGIDPSKQTGNNWVNGIFFTTIYEKISPQKANHLLDNSKYIIIGQISPTAKVYDRTKTNEKEFNAIASQIQSLAKQLADRYPQKEALRQAFLEKGIEVIIGGHDKYEATAFTDDAINITAIYEIE